MAHARVSRIVQSIDTPIFFTSVQNRYKYILMQFHNAFASRLISTITCTIHYNPLQKLELISMDSNGKL